MFGVVLGDASPRRPRRSRSSTATNVHLPPVAQRVAHQMPPGPMNTCASGRHRRRHRDRAGARPPGPVENAPVLRFNAPRAAECQDRRRRPSGRWDSRDPSASVSSVPRGCGSHPGHTDPKAEGQAARPARAASASTPTQIGPVHQIATGGSSGPNRERERPARRGGNRARAHRLRPGGRAPPTGLGHAQPPAVTRQPLGLIWMPAPTSVISGACFQHADAGAAPRQRQCGGQPAYAAAQNRHLLPDQHVFAPPAQRKRGTRLGCPSLVSAAAPERSAVSRRDAPSRAAHGVPAPRGSSSRWAARRAA